MNAIQIRKLSDFALGLRFVSTEAKVNHLRQCPDCRKRFGALECLRLGLELRKLRREIKRRRCGMTVLPQTVDLSTAEERKSVYEAPVILN